MKPFLALCRIKLRAATRNGNCDAPQRRDAQERLGVNALTRSAPLTFWLKVYFELLGAPKERPQQLCMAEPADDAHAARPRAVGRYGWHRLHRSHFWLKAHVQQVW